MSPMMTDEQGYPWAAALPLIVLFAAWLLGLIVYAVRAKLVGRYRHEKVDQHGGTWLLNRWVMEYGYWVIHGAGRVLIRLRVNPNTITAASLLSGLAASLALCQGHFGLGGWLLLGAGILDILDGMVARDTGTASLAGVFFDTVADRYCELVFFLAGMAYYFPFEPAIAVIVGLAMIASIMITFNRTKAEALGIVNLPNGMMRRHERLCYLGAGTAASPLLAFWLEPGAARPVYHLAVIAFLIVAVFGNIAAIRLAQEVHRRLRMQDQAKATEPV